MKKIFNRLSRSGAFSPLDLHFSKLIYRLAGRSGSDGIALAAALVSRNQREGHICLDLSAVADTPVSEDRGTDDLICPALAEWENALRSCGVVGSPGDHVPLILDNKHRLYLCRYWEYQDHLAKRLRERLCAAPPETDMPLLERGLAQFFPDQEPGKTDWQKVAAFTALTRWFCVISGGPGTGKTTTVARILALLLSQAGERRLRIALAAPTGKAAARLQEAILREKEKFDAPLREAITAEASTLHRLLGSIPHSHRFRHDKNNPLPADVVVVDEASMVDLALMSKLVQALKPRSRLILLGDRDQLASVEAGAVLGDICDTGNVHRAACAVRPEDDPGICDAIVQLRKSYRFGGESGIRRISREINAGHGKAALEILNGGAFGDIRWQPLPPRAPELASALRDAVTEGFGGYLERPDDPASVFAAFDSFRILCALRKGPYGAVEVNRLAEEILHARRIIFPGKTWYTGRPVLITRNDYLLKLFNGDVGIALPDPESGGDLRVFFPAGDGAFRKISPVRLPDHETVFAMTVHKSQGSEFDRVLLLLPDRDARVLTRELMYTGITRAVRAVEIRGTEQVFLDAVARPIRRTSGLRDALWGTAAPGDTCRKNGENGAE
ncbi:exodeoxyribonuclease V subunit alpha [Desulfonema ishimotonii]|uniref:Exodeoxyribonuclease V subunit alpha n=1 Tax=Desulfonema ishimotonii TaxID=45657 RepID=A0A401FYM6_9BACT|nr:exodeoxyribonuclease V subunit alpha [Desulfonema ishimotonii]GBC62050.1 exodeoxyribonuclease V subunit alpha [Desulfonema ishimotonii]